MWLLLIEFYNLYKSYRYDTSQLLALDVIPLGFHFSNL